MSDPNRESTRRAYANGHAGGTRSSTLGPSVIEPPLKRKRDDPDESMLCRGPTVLDAKAASP